MPSKTAKQARFFRAVAHGWRPSDMKAPPIAVARDFMRADEAAKAQRTAAARPRPRRRTVVEGY